MKPSGIFKQYIWLINTIHRAGKITLQELNNRWIRTEMSGGMPMNRITFNRHRNAIEEMFDICIECQRKGGYYYYIENKEVFTDNNLQQWMLDSLSISNMLMESSSLKQRIMLENIPAGKEYLQPIINAMKLNRKLQMTYRKFHQPTGYTITVEPYAIKVFRQRWYLLANDYKASIHPSMPWTASSPSKKRTKASFSHPILIPNGSSGIAMACCLRTTSPSASLSARIRPSTTTCAPSPCTIHKGSWPAPPNLPILNITYAPPSIFVRNCSPRHTKPRCSRRKV